MTKRRVLMRRKYSIGFFLVVVLVILLFAVGNRLSTVLLEEYYVIKDYEGYLTVFTSEGKIYEYTSILTTDLPETLQEGIDSGIQVDKIEDVYGFLENYSS